MSNKIDQNIRKINESLEENSKSWKNSIPVLGATVVPAIALLTSPAMSATSAIAQTGTVVGGAIALGVVGGWMLEKARLNRQLNKSDPQGVTQANNKNIVDNNPVLKKEQELRGDVLEARGKSKLARNSVIAGGVGVLLTAIATPLFIPVLAGTVAAAFAAYKMEKKEKKAVSKLIDHQVKNNMEHSLPYEHDQYFDPSDVVGMLNSSKIKAKREREVALPENKISNNGPVAPKLG